MGVGGAPFPVMVPLLLAENVLSKGIVLDGKVPVEQLCQGVVNGCATCQNLGIVGVKVGVDEVDIGRASRFLRRVSVVATESMVANRMMVLYISGPYLMPSKVNWAW